MTSPAQHADRWQPYIDRIQQGEWRSVVLRDMILDDIKQQGLIKPVLMDIGCGHGFDTSTELQQSLADIAGEYIGVEPDREITLQPFITSAHRSFFEDAAVPDQSVDMAFCVMVLEHIPDPQKFWNKVHATLKPGGVFWALTVDSRHWFALGSQAMEAMHIKDAYLRATHGERGEERYENYPVHYRTNSPRQIERLSRAFSDRSVYSVFQPGSIGYYFPKLLKPAAELACKLTHTVTGVGNNLIVRAQK
ncbi:MAG: class I SAM-dependent methyltransferase [bacterium]|nr:class I SAM-dependent methyltransferase [Candidatus Kapabacteria bacterium]